MIRINLLPVKAAQKKEKLQAQLIVAAVAVVVTLGLCAAAYFQLTSWVGEAQANVEQKKAEVARLVKVIGEVNEFKKRQEVLQSKLDILDKLEKSRSGPVLFLDELYRALPEKVWLESFKEDGKKVVIAGIGVNEETVAIFLSNLEASKEFAGVVLKGTQQVVKDGVKLNKFDVECNLENPRVEVAAPAAPAKKK